MNHSKMLTSFLAPFIHQLYVSGVRDVVISPGSRSTPLTVLFKEHPNIKIWMNVDERSAAFFALGIAKGKQAPVALVCSSGTASANFYPAIIEAKYSEIPLIVLTADRPHELREVGAPQAIDQVKLYGDHVKFAVDLPLPEENRGIHDFMGLQASKAMRVAMEAPKGPVHLNLPFREPLMPEVREPIPWNEETRREITNHYSESHLNEESMRILAEKLSKLKKPLIVAGPEQEEQLGFKIHDLAEKLQAPVLADPLSQLRSGAHPKKWIVDGYDAFLRSAEWVEAYKADGIIRFGPLPVSKPFLKYMERLDLKTSIVVSHGGRTSDPTQQVTDWVKASPLSFVDALVKEMDHQEVHTDKVWSEKWLQVNELTKEVTNEKLASSAWFEGHVIADLIPKLPSEAKLFTGNSMPIRDLDSFFQTTEQSIRTYGNRGANGIDGINSTVLGLSTSQKPTYLVIGDLSFFHDTNGLMAGKQYDLDLTLIVVNNNGGGIFSFLPQAESATHFEELFATPLDLEVADVARLYKGRYYRVTNRDDYQLTLEKVNHEKGLKFIECVTNRPDNVASHQAYWNEVKNKVGFLTR
ncbi:2-succinyl-5-enolpyruvyl-6-hydroxy-3-cyclohexene-1-carboxylic-acid synthase [Pullulanibacillus sp. KACC 23026]|uniref:2-succinyl-5-enolpyruvyl-6-hydroxy-3- cyclohexene-1-carboxylic-acid synthase n=1 Tax=Pullulanibacillus sp. KACC 23026 TaxID=3028315 RepID=UPI0023B15F23|nr:2-succinyl-5-enolpyruvyl-6-hydroxy-3-cyclohexene-1-carboxylic-acid synthase [Pullulanibacillus sp. KACC 23026]WEG11983.1 2-succinyl-5-enolpyruvyl-6-hydroxy-3-cyclohexene-1-carboxylic-acid synthase [Pullulanibacillus sp. KACC 23026]